MADWLLVFFTAPIFFLLWTQKKNPTWGRAIIYRCHVGPIQFSAPLKPIKHHSTMVSRGLMGALIWVPIRTRHVYSILDSRGHFFQSGCKVDKKPPDKSPLICPRETASLGIMGATRVPPLNPSETIVLSAAHILACLWFVNGRRCLQLCPAPKLAPF